MRVLAARIGCDLSGYIWVADGTGGLTKRRWRNGTVPAYPAVVKRTESYLDLIELGVNIAMKQYGLPLYLKDEMRSEAALQVSRALRNATREDNRALVKTAAIRGAIDAARREWGRAAATDDLKNIRRPSYLEEHRPPDAGDDGSAWEEFIADDGPLPGDALAQVDRIKSILARLPNQRHREIALRYAYGQPEHEIGAMMGVSESRVSQILAQIRKRLDETEGMDRWGLEKIPLGTRALNSLTVSWR